MTLVNSKLLQLIALKPTCMQKRMSVMLLTASRADFCNAFTQYVGLHQKVDLCVRECQSDALLIHTHAHVEEAQASALVRVTASTSATPAGCRVHS